MKESKSKSGIHPNGTGFKATVDTVLNKSSNDGNVTSGEHLSYWLTKYHPSLNLNRLNEAIDTDILIVGGGVSGLTAAYCLLEAGFRVVVLEDGFIGSGESGRTTGHLTCVLDTRYSEIEKRFDERVARYVAASHSSAIDWIEKTIQKHAIDCHFKRVPGYLISHPTDSTSKLREEQRATLRAGLMTEFVNQVPGISSTHVTWGIRYPDQGQLNIQLYLRGLAKTVTSMGGQIFTQTRVENINKEGATANGHQVRAKNIVVATNTPVNDRMAIHTKQWPYRTYVIAGKIPKGRLPYSLWWDTGDQESRWISKPYHFVRLEEFDEHFDLLIAGGEDHRTAQADQEHIKEEDRYKNLERWTRKHFPDVLTFEHKWSGQLMEPLDGLGFIGKNPGDDNIYIITGQSGNGMTYAPIGGQIITDLILGRDNNFSDMYHPGRITFKTTGKFLQEVGNMVAQYADWFTSKEKKTQNSLQPGQGMVISKGMKKIAVYCDDQGLIHHCSAVCPHLGAVLHWNADEKTFDCPMHGSRFTGNGILVNGPATHDLKQMEKYDQRIFTTNEHQH